MIKVTVFKPDELAGDRACSICEAPIADGGIMLYLPYGGVVQMHGGACLAVWIMGTGADKSLKPTQNLDKSKTNGVE